MWRPPVRVRAVCRFGCGRHAGSGAVTCGGRRFKHDTQDYRLQITDLQDYGCTDYGSTDHRLQVTQITDDRLRERGGRSFEGFADVGGRGLVPRFGWHAAIVGRPAHVVNRTTLPICWVKPPPEPTRLTRRAYIEVRRSSQAHPEGLPPSSRNEPGLGDTPSY